MHSLFWLVWEDCCGIIYAVTLSVKLGVSTAELDKDNVSQEVKQMVIDDKTKQSTQEVLFDFIAKSVSDFMKEQNITRKLPLGFTFSFPVHQTSLISGTLIRWTKDFSATGAERKDVVQLLKDAFIRQGVSERGLGYSSSATNGG